MNLLKNKFKKAFLKSNLASLYDPPIFSASLTNFSKLIILVE